ncbi:MAG: hypothetical protein ACI8P3_002958 [Saprospiraceae bacterium]|jgi:hypothetical protein
MKKFKGIQFGFSGIVCLLFVASLFVGCGGSDTADDTRNALADATAVNTSNPATPATPATTKPAEPAAPVGPTTVMAFNELEFDYGVVDEGEKVVHIYKFKNTGKEPLIISNAKGSCGCTVPSWPKEPIPPGASGEINVEFNSKGKKGKQSKRVTITANTDPVQTFLTIKGEVKGDPAADKGGVKPTSITPKSPSK